MAKQLYETFTGDQVTDAMLDEAATSSVRTTEFGTSNPITQVSGMVLGLLISNTPQENPSNSMGAVCENSISLIPQRASMLE